MRNPPHEQALNRFGIKYEYVESVPVGEINTTRGKQLQARLVPLDDGLIEEYKEMFNEGSKPPPLLLWKHGRSLLVPLDGNQRLAANERANAKHKLKAFDAYVVTTDDPMVADRLCWQFNNTVNGRRLSYEESLQHAVTMVRKYGQVIAQVAKDWSVKAWELSAKVREAELRDLAERKGIDTTRIPAANLIELNPLLNVGENLALTAIKTIATTGIDQKSIKRAMDSVAKARTTESKIKVLEDWANSEEVQVARAATKNGRIAGRKTPSPKSRLERQLNALEDLLGNYNEKALTGGGSEQRSTALFICNKLIVIYGLGALLKGQGVE